MEGQIRTILGDVEDFGGIAYCHEHLIIDSPLIASAFPDIYLHDVDKAVEELSRCAEAGVGLVVDAMPASAGRNILKLARVASSTPICVVAATGLHHDRYYGAGHWSNHVSAESLVELFMADLLDGIDRFDYTGPVVERTTWRAGVLKVATSGAALDSRDQRNLEAVGQASIATGAPVVTHCEGGWGGLEQVARLGDMGVPSSSVILSHVDKTDDFKYLIDLAETGAVLELDRFVRDVAVGAEQASVGRIARLVDSGFTESVVVGTDGAKRELWASLGGTPGLSCLAERLPSLLRREGLSEQRIQAVMHDNGARALRWRK